MSSQKLKLIPFGKHSDGSKYSLEAEVVFTESKLKIIYLLRGNLEDLIIVPKKTGAGQIDDLWKSTCFEAFISKKKSFRYIEWNFSSSQEWGFFAFESYRKAAPEKLIQSAPEMRIKRSKADFVMEINLNLKENDSFFENADPYEMGLSVVLKSRDGKQSYWAISHSGTKPDFHLRDTFKVQL
ncbi:MAG: hypothetical protein JWQ35_2574 [Bacteriovoracaceae bacterium]|nr:hypothetical protein [Bacteriovoracaceae bacterium]